MPNADRAAVAREVLAELVETVRHLASAVDDWRHLGPTEENSDSIDRVVSRLEALSARVQSDGVLSLVGKAVGATASTGAGSTPATPSAPAAPVTVTLGGRTYTESASRWDANELWVAKQSELGLALSRIASDARRIEKAERENARLRDEADYSDGGVGYLNAVNHGTNQAVSVLADLLDNGRPARVAFGGEKLEALAKRLEALKRERDEARRLYAESEAALALANDNTRLWRERVTTGLGASTTEEGHVERSSTSAPAQQSPSPAPIPLGAPRRWLLVVDAEGIAHECAEANEMEQSLRDLRDVERTYHEKGRVVPVIEAVADAATVERVARAILDNDREQLGPSDWEWNVVGESVRGSYLSNARAALRALGYEVAG